MSLKPGEMKIIHFEEMPAVTPPVWHELPAEWEFALGNPDEGLNTTLERMPKQFEPVFLPHRTLNPETPYWYTTTVTLPVACALSIQADDGAQLYVNGQRVVISEDVFILPWGVKEFHLVVRVLNKAMYGGLECVRMTTMKEMEQFRRERDVHKRLTILKRKLQEMPFITEEESDAFQKAFKTKDHMDLSLAKEAFMEFPVVIAGPYLQDAGTDKMTVVWETDDNCAAHIQWGPDTKSPRGDAVEGSRTINYANLTNLKPNTEYYYRVYSNKQYTRVYRFRTLPAEGPFTFTAWGDSQNAWETLEQLVTTMRPLATSFTLGLGDMVEEGSRQQPWLELLNTLQYFIAETPFFMIGGNHEYDGCFEKMRSFFLTRYAYNQPTTHFMAWTASNARFVAIDPNNHYPTRIPLESDQYKRLMLELESPEWKQATWRFIIIHQPPYSQGWTEYQGDIPIRELLEPLIEPHGIDFVLSGHTHDYEQLTRTYGKQTTHFFILGGAGDGIESGPLSESPVMDKVVRRQHFGYFQVDGNRVTIQAISPDGEVFDTLEVEK